MVRRRNARNDRMSRALDRDNRRVAKIVAELETSKDTMTRADINWVYEVVDMLERRYPCLQFEVGYTLDSPGWSFYRAGLGQKVQEKFERAVAKARAKTHAARAAKDEDDG